MFTFFLFQCLGKDFKSKNIKLYVNGLHKNTNPKTELTHETKTKKNDAN